MGQCGGPLACPFGQIAFGQGLQSPSEAFEQPGSVAGRDGFTEQVGVAATAAIFGFREDARNGCWPGLLSRYPAGAAGKSRKTRE